MDFIDFTAGQNDSDRRLDKVLRALASDYSLSELYKFMRKGLVRVNGKKAKEDYRVQKGDLIQLASFIMVNTEKKSQEQIKLQNIVFENENLLVLNKPYDISVHGSDNSLDKSVRAYLSSFSQASLSFKPGPLHRLDRKTSGLIVFSKSLLGAQWFSQHINDHSLIKVYAAILQGHVESELSWKDYIYAREESGSGFHKVSCSHKKETDEWKEAKSHCLPLAYGNYKGKAVTLAQITIFTGRKHQIRAQSSLNGYPLLGDSAYGGQPLSGLYRDFYLAAVKIKLGEELINNEAGMPEELCINPYQEFFDIIKYCDIK
ncbi:MAG: RluA family pseudouridine synthase [Treponema sp.]|nr:RluA family pseudouridine synthase [Treponema sp.]